MFKSYTTHLPDQQLSPDQLLKKQKELQDALQKVEQLIIDFNNHRATMFEALQNIQLQLNRTTKKTSKDLKKLKNDKEILINALEKKRFNAHITKLEQQRKSLYDALDTITELLSQS